MPIGAPVVVAVLVVVGFLLILFVVTTLYRKVGPNQALIVYGLGGTRVVVGSGTVILPLVQTWNQLSLELMSFDVAPQQDLYTNQGVAVNVEAVSQLKVKNDLVSIRTAAEQFLSKPEGAREQALRLVMEGHLRGIVGQLTIEEIVKQPEMVAEKMRRTVAEDLDKMGLEVVSFTIKEIKDKNQYIDNMGKPDIARIKRAAAIAAAEAERDIQIRQAETLREASVAQALAEQERVIAETASATRQAEAQRDLNLRRSEYDALVKRQQAQADKSYDIQAAIEQQRVVAEQVKVEVVEREEQIKVQQAEITRREAELAGSVLKQAEAERKRIEMLAEAERQRVTLEALGQADAAKAQGLAEAEVNRQKGLAEADVIQTLGQAEATAILAKGSSEAEAMRQKAAAYQQYNQAAILDKLLAGLPDLARAMSEPLTRVDKITVVSVGDGKESGVGTEKIVAEVAKMMAQTPALVESLAGMTVADLMRHVPGIRLPDAGDGHAGQPLEVIDEKKEN